jgi:ATP-binding cassette subfamily C protein CydD
MHVERRLLRENQPARREFRIAVGLAFLAAAAWLVSTWLFSEVVSDVFLANHTLSGVGGLLAAMGCLLVLRAGLIWASDVTAQRSANRVKHDLRERLTARLMALGPTYTRGERTGELVYAATAGVEALDDYITQFQPARLLASLVPALVFAAILILDPWTLPILLFTGPILVILLALIGGRAKQLTARRHVEMSWMSAHFLDMLQGLATLKMFGRSKEQAASIETIGHHYSNTTMEVLRTAFQTSLVLEWGATAATALVAIEVSLRLMNGLMPFDRALAVLLLTPEFFQPMRQLALKYHSASAGKAAAERIYAILDAAPHVLAISSGATTVEPTRHDIRFEDVHVTYEGGQRVALSGFTFAIAQGETVALVGETGAGKTTVANLLLRFVEPTRGTITVGGIPMCDISPDQWRKRVAWVSQHPHLFHATVAENLRLARADATLDDIVAAARAANAHGFIERLPQGYDTPLGERGARLSGGQRQRIAIARAFLKDAPVLILDEPTSHLDSDSEEAIRDALVRLVRRRTVLIIAHRLALAYDADEIVVMHRGRVVETGNRFDLIRQNGLYRRLEMAYEGGMR